jgi:hypothetical protein
MKITRSFRGYREFGKVQSNSKIYLDDNDSFFPPTPKCFMMVVVPINRGNDWVNWMKVENLAYIIHGINERK